jgi:hypothetical protein
MKKDSKCEKIRFLESPLDQQGKLYVDGNMHSTGLFDLDSGLYVSDIRYSLDIPIGTEIFLIADAGPRIEISRIEKCPSGDAHHHFTVAFS